MKSLDTHAFFYGPTGSRIDGGSKLIYETSAMAAGVPHRCYRLETPLELVDEWPWVEIIVPGYQTRQRGSVHISPRGLQSRIWVQWKWP
jgi:hypothetical protein